MEKMKKYRKLKWIATRVNDEPIKVTLYNENWEKLDDIEILPTKTKIKTRTK